MANNKTDLRAVGFALLVMAIMLPFALITGFIVYFIIALILFGGFDSMTSLGNNDHLSTIVGYIVFMVIIILTMGITCFVGWRVYRHLALKHNT